MATAENVPNVACVRDIESAKNTLSPICSLRARISHVGHVCEGRTYGPLSTPFRRPHRPSHWNGLFGRSA